MCELLHRAQNIQLQTEIIQDTQDDFKYPRHAKKMAMGEKRTEMLKESGSPTDAEILECIRKAQRDVTAVVYCMGIPLHLRQHFFER